VQNIARVVQELAPDSLFLVDAVTSLGGLPVRMDEWGIDALYSGSQKCLSCPPGLSPVALSERAMQVALGRQTPIPNWYLDLSLLIKYWDGEQRAYHHTAPMNMIYGLYQALQDLTAEGLERAFERHLDVHRHLVTGLEKMGLGMLVAPEARLPTLNAVAIPTGVDDAGTRSRLRREHLIEIGGGLGALAGKVWRVGLMGSSARKENVDSLLTAIKTVLGR
jgi:alanine-glyoxylate transaminase/serine-glyoxylate transaminase/serine-pyruvate transaminase